MSSVLKANWKQDDFWNNTFFYKLTIGNKSLVSQLLSKVTDTSCSFYIKMFNVSTLLLDDAFKSATPLTNGVINETLLQFASLSGISQDSVATHFRCGGVFCDGFLQIFSWFWHWNYFENRLIFDRVRRTKIVPIFGPSSRYIVAWPTPC